LTGTDTAEVTAGPLANVIMIATAIASAIAQAESPIYE
jgi:hypothetical protein